MDGSCLGKSIPQKTQLPPRWKGEETRQRDANMLSRQQNPLLFRETIPSLCLYTQFAPQPEDVPVCPSENRLDHLKLYIIFGWDVWKITCKASWIGSYTSAPRNVPQAPAPGRGRDSEFSSKASATFAPSLAKFPRPWDRPPIRRERDLF